MSTIELTRARFVTRDRCINCGSATLETLDRGTFHEGPVFEMISGSPQGEDPLPALVGAEWVLQKCGACAQVFHRNVLDPEWMGVAYSRWASAEAMAEFARLAGIDSFINLYRAELGRAKHAHRLEAMTRDLRGAGAVRLVDFGCGKGEFIQTCLSHGFEAYGVDFSTSRMESAAVKIVPTLDDAPGQFHVATLFEVLEHVAAPLEILEALAERLVPGGILVVETPDCTGVTGLRSRHDTGLIDPIQHVNGYTAATLTAIVERAGFRRVKRPMAIAASDWRGIARGAVGYLLGRGENSTQQYFRKT